MVEKLPQAFTGFSFYAGLGSRAIRVFIGFRMVQEVHVFTRTVRFLGLVLHFLALGKYLRASGFPSFTGCLPFWAEGLHEIVGDSFEVM